MGRRKAAATGSRKKSSKGGETAALGTVVPLTREGRRRPDSLPLASAQPTLENLISEGQQQQAEFLKLRWQRDLSLGVAAAILVCFIATLWWLFERPLQPRATAQITAPVAAPEVPPAPTAAPDSRLQEDIALAIEAWAASWSAQDVDAYLSFYAADFQVPDQTSRQAWEAQRRQRLLAPRLIAVALKDIEVELAGPDAAVARFVQTYASPGYGDRVSKSLVMVREAGQWRIREERSSGFEPAS